MCYIEMNPCLKIQLGRSNFYNGKRLKDGPTIGDVLLRLYLLHDWSTSSVPILAPVRSALHLFFFPSFFGDELLTFTGVRTDYLLRTIGPSHKGSRSVPDATSQSDWIAYKSVCDVKSRKGPCPFCLDHQPFLEACKRKAFG